jgi:hypothetical protein
MHKWRLFPDSAFPCTLTVGLKFAVVPPPTISLWSVSGGTCRAGDKEIKMNYHINTHGAVRYAIHKKDIQDIFDSGMGGACHA